MLLHPLRDEYLRRKSGNVRLLWVSRSFWSFRSISTELCCNGSGRGSRALQMSTSDRFLLAGVMGWPVMHSRSPMIHNHLLATHGLNGTYVPLAIRPEQLAGALRGLAPLGFSGCNITIPHKQQAMAIVD